MTQTNITTGNPIVDAISKLNITGNIIPEIWYRPTEHRDESGLAISYTRKFADKDYLQ